MKLLLTDLISIKPKVGEDVYGAIYGDETYQQVRIEEGGRISIDNNGNQFFPRYTLVSLNPIPRESLVRVIKSDLMEPFPGELLVKSLRGAKGLDGTMIYEVSL